MASSSSSRQSLVVVIDDDAEVRDSLAALLESADYAVATFASATAFLAKVEAVDGHCLVVDIRMPDMDGLELQQELARRGVTIPVIVVTGHGDVPLAVRAMKAGAVDFLEKPYDSDRLLGSVGRALEQRRHEQERAEAANDARERISHLTPREREILQLIVAGHPNKVIGAKLQISPRTVEVHRARLIDKTQARNLSDLIRWAMAAGIMPA